MALSVDDTKLLPSIQPYLDAETDKWYLIGSTGEPMEIPDPDNFQKELDEAESSEATKVNFFFLQSELDELTMSQIRVYVLHIPLPKMRPIVLAALAIPDGVDAQTLVGYGYKILKGLMAKNIWVLSYACDGTETERSSQKQLAGKADSYHEYIIPGDSTDSSASDLKFKIPLFNGRPTVFVQDSKHSLKTFRNNLFSGARLLVLGDSVAFYAMVREMGFDSNSPIYHRDVEKLDRQDDCAAARLFSASSLEWMTDRHPEWTGVAVYLFVFGELVDAYQNRSISHLERVRMVLRARHFLDIWKEFLNEAGYKKTKHFISREAENIALYIIEGFIGLLIGHRDFLRKLFPHIKFPFLPWLYSTEVCEHLFGECRKLKKDFTYADFIYLVPELHLLMEAAMKLETITKEKATARAGASANHSFLDPPGSRLRLGFTPYCTC